MGGAPRAAIAMGEGHYEKAGANSGQLHRYAGQACPRLLFVIFAGVLCDPVLALLLRQPVQRRCRMPRPTCGFICWAPSFAMVTLGLNAFITNQGYAKTSMLTTCVGALLNLALDPLLIYGLGMGVTGRGLGDGDAPRVVSATMILRFPGGKARLHPISGVSWFRPPRRSGAADPGAGLLRPLSWG